MIVATRRPIRLFRVAVQLLTRFPVRLSDVDDQDLRAAIAFYPLVGLLVAAVGVGVRAATAPLVGSAPAAVLAVTAMVLSTGAFHEDGLADTADGLWGGWTPERRIEIMRDSRIGAYGAAALVLSLAFRITLLAPLDLVTFARAVVAGHVLGRTAGVLLAATLRPVSDQGLGAKVIGPAGRWTGIAVALASVVVAAVTAREWLLLPLLATVIAVGAMRRLARLRLGGLTGDTLGAVNQLTLLLVMATIVAIQRHS